MFGGVKCHSVTIYVNQARDSREVFWAGGGFKTLEWEDSNAPDTAGRRFYEHWSWGEHTFVRIAFSGGLQNGSIRTMDSGTTEADVERTAEALRCAVESL